MSHDDDRRRKRVAVIAVSSMLLVAMVVAAIWVKSDWSLSPKDGSKQAEVSTSMKSVQAICQPTDFKETCVKSLSAAAQNSSNPKDLIKAAFEVAAAEINKVAENSTLLKELEKDPKTKTAVDDCKELFGDAVDDLKRSFNEIGRLDLNNYDGILASLKIWLSATVTYQETCLDGFENATGDASEKMRELLKTSMELSSNGMAIVTEMSSIVHSMQISSFNRRLLSVPDGMIEGHDRDVFNDIGTLVRWRRLLASGNVFLMGHEFDDYYDDPADVIKGRRLLSKITSHAGVLDGQDGLPTWLDKPRRALIDAKSPKAVNPDVVVAKDGTGKYKTIGEALNDVPKWNNNTFIIYVKEGVYQEYLRIEKWWTHLVLIGDGPTKTRISGDLNFVDGTPTFKTATLSVLADHFLGKDIGIENTAGAIKHQAVALRVQSDMSIFYNCHFDGYQDTLYAHTYRQFYRDCRISGTIDFVFGDAASFFQNCTFVVRKPLENQNCIVAAQGRKERHQPTGIVIHKSTFTTDPEYYPIRFTNKAYLARPWKEYSKTIIMESYIEDLIQPDGWLPWIGTFALDTCYYGEYDNGGPGANMTGRVKWRGVKTIIPSRAEKFMPPIFFGVDDWIIASGVPYIANLTTIPPPELAALPQGVDEDPNAPVASPSKEDGHDVSSKSSSESDKSNADHQSSSTISMSPTISPAPSPSPVPSKSATLDVPRKSEIAIVDLPRNSEEATSGPQIQVQDLERVLMEEGGEDMTQNDDMMGPIPDGTEPGPAHVEPHGPARSPSTGSNLAPSENAGPRIARSPYNGPSLAPLISPANEDPLDLGPVPSPGPSDGVADDEARSPSADAVPPAKSGSRSRHEVQIILSGLAILAALVM
ncbi:hypothetical protein Nepgr_009574 [Nepenthes gracilis]|uniref:pectinesterase n=1 Tax=Nepenthes gracilis TaxID=150966 RepID=A0AAD3SBL0_NEPGR|nr:hypothetical protein Nepgr_009574 [Nepenthes gracilis]